MTWRVSEDAVPARVRGWYPLVSHSPHSSGERATASGAVSAGSNPAGGASNLPAKYPPYQARCCRALGSLGRQVPPPYAAIRPVLHPSCTPAPYPAASSGRSPPGHPGYPYVVQADHAPGVGAGEHFDAVASPFGDLGGGYPGVETPHDARVPQVVGPFHQRRCQLVRHEGQRPDFPPDLPPGRWLDLVALLAAEKIAIGAAPNCPMCALMRHTSSGGIGTFRTDLRERPFRPRFSCTSPVLVHSFPGAGAESPKVRRPQPVIGRWHPALVSRATSAGRIMA
jgi:hypothetical protein